MSTSTQPARDALAAELQRLTDDPDALLPFEELNRLRRAAYREAASALQTTELSAWAQRMAETYGTDRATAWHNVVSWPVALMVARYGEDVTNWPDALSTEDVARAGHWLTNMREISPGIFPLTVRVNALPAEQLLGLNESNS